MVRSYWVEGDTARGEDFEYRFNSRAEAEAWYDKIVGVPYKVMKAYDDKLGDIIIKSESSGEV